MRVAPHERDVREVGATEARVLEVGRREVSVPQVDHRGLIYLLVNEFGLVQEAHEFAFSLSVQAAKRGEGDRARDRPDRIVLLGGHQSPV